MARRRQRRRRNSDDSTRRLERAAAESGDPFDYARFALAKVREGSDDVRLHGWALLAMGDWGPTENEGYLKLATPIRIFVTNDNGYVRPLDVGSVRLAEPLEFHTSNPRARSAFGGMGLLRVHAETGKRFEVPVDFNWNMSGNGPWEIATKIEAEAAGAMPEKKKHKGKATEDRPIKLGTKRSRKIFEQALGGNSYSLGGNFIASPLSAEYVRTELEADARQTRKSMRPEGGGKYSISYHSNHWVEFWSPAEQEVEGFTPAAPVAPMASVPMEPAVPIHGELFHGQGGTRAAKAAANGRPFRAPHYTANDRAVAVEVEMARGGVLMLDEVEQFRAAPLRTIRDLLRSWRGPDAPYVFATISDASAFDRLPAWVQMLPESLAFDAPPPPPVQPPPPPAVAAPSRPSRRQKTTWLEQLAPEAAAAFVPAPREPEPAPAYLAQADLFVPDPEAVAAYEDRLEAKRDRLEERAEAHRGKAASLLRRGDLREEYSGIPFGQPILVGHHSERRHRKALERAESSFRKGIEADQYASHLASRADRVGSGGISADDPAAIVKLREKLASLEASRDYMKKANSAIQKAARKLKIRAKGIRDRAQAAEVLAAAGIPERQQEVLLRTFELTPYHGLGYASYNLTNSGAEIRRVKQRLAELIAEHERAPAEDVEHEGFYVTEDEDLNRIQLMFEGKPGERTRKLLKSNGFRWSPRNSAWQRQLNEAGRRSAAYVASQIVGEEHGGWLQNPADLDEEFWWLSNPYIKATQHPVLTRESYPGVFQDTDGDGILDVDDPFPGRFTTQQLEEVSLASEIGEIIDLRGQFDERRGELVRRLKGTGIPGRIKSRTKTPYSIINKLRRKRIMGEQGLTDIAAAMIVVPGRHELEEVTSEIMAGALGEVAWFGDFYAEPLGGYRARHFTITVDGLPTELQLKTERMAELGHAAHTAYKTGALDPARMDYLSVLADQADQGDSAAASEFAALEASGDFGLGGALHNPHSTEDLEYHRANVIAAVDRMIRAENAGNIREAQRAYDYLQGYCEQAGCDLGQTIEGARRHLVSRSVGVLDTQGYATWPRANPPRGTEEDADRLTRLAKELGVNLDGWSFWPSQDGGFKLVKGRSQQYSNQWWRPEWVEQWLRGEVRRQQQPRENPERVTFGKMDQWEASASEGNIYLDGEDVGSIVGVYEDLGSGMANEWFVAAYRAEFWTPGSDHIYSFSEHVDRDYQNEATGPGGARGALSRLRKRVRDILDPKFHRLKKGHHGPRQFKPRKNPMANYHHATVYTNRSNA